MNILSASRLVLVLKIAFTVSILDAFADDQTPAPPDGVTMDPKSAAGISMKTPSLAIREEVTFNYTYVGGADLRSGATGAWVSRPRSLVMA
ncbi:MAG: hypothetical protein WDO13_15720 [Verrucomicrobiota bacterium]